MTFEISGDLLQVLCGYGLIFFGVVTTIYGTARMCVTCAAEVRAQEAYRLAHGYGQGDKDATRIASDVWAKCCNKAACVLFFVLVPSSALCVIIGLHVLGVDLLP